MTSASASVRDGRTPFAAFYGHFAAAFGTIVLAIITLALLLGSHVNTGTGGLVIILLASLAYAVVRVRARGSAGTTVVDLEHRIAELERTRETDDPVA